MSVECLPSLASTAGDCLRSLFAEYDALGEKVRGVLGSQDAWDKLPLDEKQRVLDESRALRDERDTVRARIVGVARLLLD